MDSLLLIAACMTAGFFLTRSGLAGAHAHRGINAFLIYVSLPAMILTQLPRIFSGEISSGSGHGRMLQDYLWIPPLMCAGLFLFSALLFGAFGRRMGFTRKERGALILMAGLGNTSFVGFPLLEALIGPEAISVALLSDQLGTFLPLFTGGVLVAAAMSGEQVGLKAILRRLFGFPPFLTVIAAFLLIGLGVSLDPTLGKMLTRLSSTLIPLGLFSVGLQLYQPGLNLKRYRSHLTLGLSYKLILGPVLVGGLIGIFLRATQAPLDVLSVFEISFLEAAMGPMISASVLAHDYELEPELTNLMIAIGIPISLLTVPLWYLLLHA